MVLVSGGSSGIGLGIVRELARRPVRWRVLSMSRDPDRAAAARADLGDAGTVEFLQGDITSEADCRRVAAHVERRHGSLEGLVNSAGVISAETGIDHEEVSEWKEVIDINLTGTYTLTRTVLPQLRAAAGAAIVNLSSVCSLRPCDAVAYSVSKAGIDALTRCLARELAGDGIRVNSVAPGYVETGLQQAAGVVESERGQQEYSQRMQSLHPLGIGEPGDVAAITAFLLSDEARWITGAVIPVDGGRAL